MTTTLPTYPSHFESDVVLRNGRTLHIRPVKPEEIALNVERVHKYVELAKSWLSRT